MNWDQDKKHRFKAHLMELLLQKQAEFKKKMLELVEDKANDSKSSMGDKYETSREIIGQEMNRLDQQNKANNAQITELEQVSFSMKPFIVAGSVFEAGDMIFAWSTGLGKVAFENQDVFCFSGQSPISKTAINAKPKEEIGMPQNRMVVHWVI